MGLSQELGTSSRGRISSLLVDTGSKTGRQEAWSWLARSIPLRKDAASPQTVRENRSPLQKGWMSHTSHAQSHAQLPSQDEGAHPSPKKTRQIPLMPAQPQRQNFQKFQDCCHSWDISKRKHINYSGVTKLTVSRPGW